MQYKRFDNTIIARMDKGEEILEQLKDIAVKENIKLASISALGAVDYFEAGVYDVANKQYHKNSFKGAFEIVSLTGTINTMDGQYYSHLHMSAGGQDGKVFGGHLNKAIISATCEMVINIKNGKVYRFYDDVTGLNLFKFD